MTRAEAIKILMGYSHTPQERAALEVLIPELTESEEEKIRKELINQIEKSRHHPADKARWIAYLEKLKEQFESGRGLYYYDGEKTTYMGYPATEENPYDFAISQQEKQKEQKPAEWSEEDEKIRKTLLDYYEKALDNYTCVEWLNGITYGELCDWLKSLRPSWKPSEEQMNALQWWAELPICSPGLKSLYEDLKKL